MKADGFIGKQDLSFIQQTKDDLSMVAPVLSVRSLENVVSTLPENGMNLDELSGKRIIASLKKLKVTNQRPLSIWA